MLRGLLLEAVEQRYLNQALEGNSPVARHLVQPKALYQHLQVLRPTQALPLPMGLELQQQHSLRQEQHR